MDVIKVRLPNLMHGLVEDSYLHPHILLSVGIDRRIALIKVNDKTK